jgi:xanthine/CO dehydrogenase XdhC/CoxF family maturation factor
LRDRAGARGRTEEAALREVLAEVERWRSEGKRVALATVVKVWGSAPRPVGSKMAVSSAGDMAGSVSGGCVEGAVFEESQGVIASSRPKLLRFGVTDEEAWAVGLSCGGEIEVFVEPLGAGGEPGSAPPGTGGRSQGR